MMIFCFPAISVSAPYRLTSRSTCLTDFPLTPHQNYGSMKNQAVVIVCFIGAQEAFKFPVHVDRQNSSVWLRLNLRHIGAIALICARLLAIRKWEFL